MTDRLEKKTPFLRGHIETREDAERVIKRASNAFLILCGLVALTQVMNLVQQGTDNNRVGEYIGIIIGNLIALSIIAIPALILKTRYSNVAAKFLMGLFGLCFAFGLYLLLIPGIFSGDTKMSMTGALMVMFWACFIRLALRADYAAKIVKGTLRAA